MKSLTTQQKSLLQEYARSAPEFSVIGEKYGHPVVVIVDYPYRQEKRTRCFIMDQDGFMSTWFVDKAEPVNLESLDEDDRRFIQDYIVD